MKHLYAALFANAVLMTAIVLYQIWSGGGMGADSFFKLLVSGFTVGIFLSFIAVLRMDFVNLASKRLGYAVFALAYMLQALILLAIWEIWIPDALFWKVTATCGILLGLAFYLLNLKEDLVRDRRQKEDGFLD